MKAIVNIALIFILLVIFSCKKGEQQHEANSYYTCPMHSTVRSDKPGACPVCNMALVKVEQQAETHEDNASMIMLDEEKQALANIQLDTVKFTTISEQTTLSGKVAPDENKLTTITARVKGRVDKLFVRQEGERISNGQALYSIYSEELLADENDYLSALKQRDKFPGQQSTVDALIESGRKKLLLWGMTEQQVKNLETVGQASTLLTYASAYNGFVTRLLINEGEYTEIGKPLFQIVDLNSIWIETQVYADEIKDLNQQTVAVITIEGIPQKVFKGKIVFENPSIQENSKVNLVRFRIDNENNIIKPGMMARVTIHHHEKQALVIPKSALLIGKMTMVWVETEPGMYESKTIHTGIENKTFVEVLHGLEEGDKVVTSGAYLLNSEFILKKGSVKAHNH